MTEAYNWQNLIQSLKKSRRSFNLGHKSLDTSPPLVLKHKEYLENQKIIERGLMRWECVRRNAQFQRLCQADKSLLDLGAGICLSSQTTSKAIQQMLSRVKINKGKKGVGFASREHEYTYSALFYFFKNLGHSEILNNQPVKCKQLHAVVHEMIDEKTLKKFSQAEVDKFIDGIPKKVDFIVDFGYTKQEIMAEFEKQIDMWGRLHGQVGQRQNKRALDYANIRRYLKVYDAKKGKVTFLELAKKFYPGTSTKNLDSAIAQVKREYKRAQELINGEFVYIK